MLVSHCHCGATTEQKIQTDRQCAHTLSLPTQVQRIYDYHRLLVQLYTITPKDHFDYHDLRFAVASVSTVSMYINAYIHAHTRMHAYIHTYIHMSIPTS